MARVKVAREYIVFSIVVAIYILINFQIISPVSLTDILMNDININVSQLSMLSGFCFLFAAIIQPFAGYFTDKHGAKKILILSFVGMLVTSIMFSFSNSFYSALLSRSIMGLSIGVAFIPLLKIIGEYFEGKRYSKMLGIYFGLGGMAGTLLGTIGLPALLNYTNWRIVFFAFSIIGLILLYLVNSTISNNVYTNDNGSIEKTSKLKEIKTIFFTKEILIIQIIFFISFGVYVSFQGLWAISYFKINQINSIQLINFILLSMSIGYFLGSFFGSYLSEKIFKCRTIPLRLALTILILAWGIITVIPTRLDIICFSCLLGIIGISIGIISPILFSVIADIIPPQNQGIALGIVNPAAMLGTFIFQIITGLILDSFKDGSIYNSYSFLIMMEFCLATLVITLFISFYLRETMQLQTASIFSALSFSNLKLKVQKIPLRVKYIHSFRR